MKVILQPFAHHGAEVAGIIFEYNTVLDLAVRKLKGIRWSQSRNCWYLPLAKESYEQLKKAVREIAAIDDRKLKIYLQKKAAVKETLVKSGTKQNQPVSKSVT